MYAEWPPEIRAPLIERHLRADADLVIFDRATVIDRATYQEPALPSAGIVHLLVGGVPVVRDGRLVEGTAAGRPIRGSTASQPVLPRT